MYNLFVSADSKAWDGNLFQIETSRCVSQYEFTDEEIVKKLGGFDVAALDELKLLPCIFAYESFHEKPPKFGIIRSIKLGLDEVRIQYVIKPIEQHITSKDLSTLSHELDIRKWELNRTHWAVKDVDLADVIKTAYGGTLPVWAQSLNTVDIETHFFDVALSFPGESRFLVEPVAMELERSIGPNSYFYDNNYVSQLARPSLDILLQDIYRNRSRLIVAFLSSDYQRKEWCGIEFRAIREIIKGHEHKRIMFIRMDDGAVDGVFQIDGYIDGRKFSPNIIAKFIQERVELLK